MGDDELAHLVSTAGARWLRRFIGFIPRTPIGVLESQHSNRVSNGRDMLRLRKILRHSLP